jgi:glycosyltransferase involved in cell wall biosynthesis
LRRCDLIIANHEALLESSNTYYKPQGHPEGVYRLVPKLTTPSIVIHNALSISSPAPETLLEPRIDRFLCVGTTPRYQDIVNKGYDLVAKVAKLHPELQFEIVGIDRRWQPGYILEYGLENTPNLKLHGYLAHSKVVELMRTSRWFIQASISEGMPNALMEAMALGCIAIGSRVAGIPTIIGDKGVLFDSRNVGKLENAIADAIALSLNPADISDRIVKVFSQSNRESQLKNAILELLIKSD